MKQDLLHGRKVSYIYYGLINDCVNDCDDLMFILFQTTNKLYIFSLEHPKSIHSLMTLLIKSTLCQHVV